MKHADVLIVGAGPAGLMLAVQLLRYGIYPYIIDNHKPDERKAKKTVLLQPRTIEYFSQLNLLYNLHNGNVRPYRGAVDIEGKKPFRVPLSPPRGIPAETNQQHHICRYKEIEVPLRSWLGSQTCPIRWQTEIIEESQDDQGVSVTVIEMGRKRSLSCRWVVHTLPTGNTVRLMSQRTLFIGEGTNRPVPPKGQSVNTDIQDAVNLGWKLALVANGKAAPELLNSYVAERTSVRQELVALDKGPILVLPDPAFGGRLAARIQYAVFRYRLRDPSFIQRFRAAATQLDIHYRNSPLSVHHSLGREIRSGDRLPFLKMFDRRTNTYTDLHSWCDKPGFSLLLFGTLSDNSLFVIGQWLRQAFPRIIHLYYLPYSSANDTIFHTFQLEPGNTRMILVRPDMHIGYMNDIVGANLIETYMHEIIKYGRQKE